MFYTFCRLLCIIFLKFTVIVKVSGRENIPKKGGFILACNHVSYLDPVAVGIVCPRRLNFMAKHDLFSHPFFSWLLYAVGAFPVRRNFADLSALKEAIHRLRCGKGLLVFPEGSRITGNTFVQPQAGIGFLVSKLNLPVIPTFIKGTDMALPKGAKSIKPARIWVYFGKQMLIERRMPYQDIAGEIMDNIRHLSC